MKFLPEDLRDNIFHFCVLYGAIGTAVGSTVIAEKIGHEATLPFFIGLVVGGIAGIWVGSRILDALER